MSGVYQPKGLLENSKVPIDPAKYLRANLKQARIFHYLDNDEPEKLTIKALEKILLKDIKVIDKPYLLRKDVTDFLLIKRHFKFFHIRL